MSHQLSHRLFDILKRIIRSKGLTYKDLSEKMHLSEPTVKRLFQERDCKLSRLSAICDVLDIQLIDLLDLESRSLVMPELLSIDVEQQLSQRRALLLFFLMLTMDIPIDVLKERNQLADSDIYQYLRELEKLELLELKEENHFRLLVSTPIKWRKDGPLQAVLVDINQRFIKETLITSGQEDFPFYSSSRMLSKKSAQRFYEEVVQLHHNFQKQSSLDQAFYPPSELTNFKFVATCKEMDLSKYFGIVKFKELQKTQ